MFTDTQAWIITVSVLVLAVVQLVSFLWGRRPPG